ncbi:MAG: lytR1 [Firmicutes bacterium]|nr:lytR1 [Bacillota bacterium]
MIRKRIFKIFLIILAVIALTAAGGYAYIYSQLNKINHVEIAQTDDELGITNDEVNVAIGEEEVPEASADLDSDITNIALFAISTEINNEPFSSDSIIVMSIDKRHDKIKLISILRDTSVNIEGYGMSKINTAYAKGGPELAIKTLNSNFNLNIRDYATVQEEGFREIIDALGGVEIYIKEYEVAFVKEFGIMKSGTYNLSGGEAFMYCSERNKGDGDFERSERQRTVLAKVFEKIKSAGITQYPALASAMMKYVETSLTVDEILQLGTSVFLENINTIEQARYPTDGYYRMELSDYSLVTDLEGTSALIHEFIYEEEQQR